MIEKETCIVLELRVNKMNDCLKRCPKPTFVDTLAVILAGFTSISSRPAVKKGGYRVRQMGLSSPVDVEISEQFVRWLDILSDWAELEAENKLAAA
eukprot:6188075-Pleurochrysis_carterae.AAC.1